MMKKLEILTVGIKVLLHNKNFQKEVNKEMNNYGYTVITTEEYKTLIEDINNKEKCISELNKINQEENKRYKIFENLFLEKMMENQEYYLENMKNVDITELINQNQEQEHFKEDKQ